MAEATNNPVADLELGAGNPEGDPGKSVSSPDSESALDAALRAEGFNPDGSAYEPKAKDITPKGPTGATGPTGASGAAETGASASGPTGAESGPAASGATGASGAAPEAKDEFDEIELPPHAKPKTTESFATVKMLARQKIAEAKKERDELKSKLEEAEKRASGLPEDTKKELEELRTFRRQMDVEADPSFKEYDAKAVANTEAMFSKLAASGFDKATIEKVKELGIQNVDWEKLLADGKITSGLKRFIDGKLFENDDLVEKKKQAIDAAKKNADKFLAERAQQDTRSDDGFATETNKHWSTEILPKIDWMKEHTITDKMSADDKKVAEAHNKLVKEVETDIKDAIADPSPSMKALMVAGYATSKKLAWELTRLKAGTDAQIKKLTDELASANKTLERIKGASPGKVNSSAPSSSTPKKITESSHLKVDTGSHLDALLAEQQAEEAARG